MKKVVTRAAPSPNGYFHIGGVRMLLHNYAYAKKHGGVFILRLEDTDTQRSEVAAAFRTLDIARKFGLEPDLHPTDEEMELTGKFDHWYGEDWLLHKDEVRAVDDGEYSDVYMQTKRSALYQKYALKLIEDGYAYPCFCSSERLKEVNDEKTANKQPTGYDGYCRGRYTADEIEEKVQAGEFPTVRLNVEEYINEHGQNLDYTDPVLGDMQFDLLTVNDQILIKSNGIATYHLAVVVDDHLMEVTNPMRGWEWIASIPKQMMLYDLLGWERLPYLHFNVLLDPDKKGKLSKRSGPVAVENFLEQGYLVDAILNFLMLTGWNSGSDKEFYTLEEFIEAFDILDISKASPTFNREKLLWFNSQYIKKSSNEDFLKVFREWVGEYYTEDEVLRGYILDDKALEDKIVTLKEKVKLLSELPEQIRFFYKKPEVKDYDWSSVKGVKRYDNIDEARSRLVELFRASSDLSSDSKDEFVAAMRELSESIEWKMGGSVYACTYTTYRCTYIT